MDLPKETDDYIRESIDYALGLPVSTHTLESKLRFSEDARRRIRDQYLLMKSKLKEKEETLQRVRAESSMNALALKKFIEENQYLADERAKAAELRAQHLEMELNKLSKEAHFCQQQTGITQQNNKRKACAKESSLIKRRIIIRKAESSMNALALKKFIEENQYLADERAKAAELRAQHLEMELNKLSKEAHFCQQQTGITQQNNKRKACAKESSLIKRRIIIRKVK